MSKEVSTVPATLLSKMGAVKADVGMNEVVSVFVSRYETGLFAKKDQLSAELKAAKKAVADHESIVIGQVDKSQFDASVPHLGLKFRAGDISVVWKKDPNSYSPKKVGVHVDVIMRDGDERDAWRKTVHLPLAATDVKEHETLTENVARLESELLDTMSLIKSVGRKERELRGRISEMRLQEAGFAELINNDQLQSLIAIK